MTSPLSELLHRKRHAYSDQGFTPDFMPDCLFDFQKSLVEWAVNKGRAALFVDCGGGKSFMEVVFAENVVRRSNRPVLILTPLAVARQMVGEAAKLGVEAVKSTDGKIPPGAKIVVTNYDRLHHFNANDFAGCVADESSILKNCDGKTKALVTDFMRKMSYRLLATATPSPNDLIELGTSSEALGYMGFNDMLTTFFKKDEDRKTNSRKDEFRSGVWRFRGHAETHFFKWMNAWSRAMRKPSDLGFSDAKFKLPKLLTREITIANSRPMEGYLMALPASGWKEERRERRETIYLRCDAAAERHNSHDRPSVAWCHLNPEGDELTRSIKGAVQVSGSDSMESKEEAFEAFAAGQITKLVTKPDIAGFGLNWQHCAHQTFFPSHSFEKYYQAVRRSWRFGQKRDVQIDLITSEGESGVLANLLRKAANADLLFDRLVSHMGRKRDIVLNREHKQSTLTPSWLA